MTMMQNSTGSSAGRNSPDFSVSELANAIRSTLEDSFGYVRVRGELSRVTLHRSGHLYSALKDADAAIDLVCWRSSVAKLSITPQEGMEVICTGRLSSYPARSTYQLIVDHIEPAGEGALLKMIEDRRKKLAAEGLFDPARKRPLPFLPSRIAIITSPTGAVIRDMLHRLRDRCPTPVTLWPVEVQGPTATAKIIDALNGIKQLKPMPDLVILARGGGSLEDLMPFNDEGVVRAVAACPVPIITAVGHETDTTLVDYAADHRAPTPTAAAEAAVPVRTDLTAALARDEKRLSLALRRTLEGRVQRLDLAAHKLSGALGLRVGKARENLLRLAARLPAPHERLRHMRALCGAMAERLIPALSRRLETAHRQLDRATGLLRTLSVEGVLERGFALILDSQSGAVLRDATTIEHTDRITIRLAGGAQVPARPR